jgi:hypothetical protein
MMLCVAGCDVGSERLVRLRGKATRDGKPVPNLFLNFVPDKGRPSWGLTDAYGEYVAQYDDQRDGVVPGIHTVFVTFKEYDPREGGRRLQEPAFLMNIVARYGSPARSPLRIEVRSQSQVIDLPLD